MIEAEKRHLEQWIEKAEHDLIASQDFATIDLKNLEEVRMQEGTLRQAQGFVLSGSGCGSLGNANAGRITASRENYSYLATTSRDILLFIFLPTVVPLSPTGYFGP